MSLGDVESRLCIRHPSYPLHEYMMHEDDQEALAPGVDCWRDNCLYGRHILAEEILRLRREMHLLRSEHDRRT